MNKKLGDFSGLEAQWNHYLQTIYIPIQVLITSYCKFVQRHNQVYWVLQKTISKKNHQIKLDNIYPHTCVFKIDQ